MSDEKKEAKGFEPGKPEGCPDDFEPQEVKQDADDSADARPGRD